jgi:hypothetical protein
MSTGPATLSGGAITLSDRNHYDIRPRNDDNDIPGPKFNLNVAR